MKRVGCLARPTLPRRYSPRTITLIVLVFVRLLRVAGIVSHDIQISLVENDTHKIFIHQWRDDKALSTVSTLVAPIHDKEIGIDNLIGGSDVDHGA